MTRALFFFLILLVQPTQAYELLKGFFRDKRVVIALVHLVVGHPEWQVRQLAAVLLRQRLLLSWKRLSEKEQVKEALLSRVAIDEKYRKGARLLVNTQ